MGVDREKITNIATGLIAALSRAELALLALLIAPTPTTGEISIAQFLKLTPILEKRGYSEKSITAALQVLVHGASISEAATGVGLTRQSVNQLMLRVRKLMVVINDDKD